eukprot:gnl/MRDRNA2_/MRDRNA2_195189_c0_seq1.p1 gnl/MRDRNA2_/MRDRNA2_195189_c0~~gnl/MRDRNA2_/MRDRNA2_195189_c0_seq1.p1  ORF type:complete len:259 (-),score=60.10 gnl/MRDRNA2_/MRDRNA2_195189_c0_seq1:86-838(-)
MAQKSARDGECSFESSGTNETEAASRSAEVAAQVKAWLRMEENKLSKFLTSNGTFASLMQHHGNGPLSDTLQRKVVKMWARTRGPEHPDTLWAKDMLAKELSEHGRHAEAVALQRLVLEALEKIMGKERPQTLVAKHHLVLMLRQLGDEDSSAASEAEQLEHEVQDAVLQSGKMVSRLVARRESTNELGSGEHPHQESAPSKSFVPKCGVMPAYWIRRSELRSHVRIQQPSPLAWSHRKGHYGGTFRAYH